MGFIKGMHIKQQLFEKKKYLQEQTSFPQSKKTSDREYQKFCLELTVSFRGLGESGVLGGEGKGMR